MKGPVHNLFDKRVKKPIVYRVGDLGEDVTMQEIVTFRVGKCRLRFDTPNFISIFLSSSTKELKSAEKIYNSLILPKLVKRERFDLSKQETVLLYDYLEHIQTSIIMAYTSVESLANDLIPIGFTYDERLSNGEIKKWQRADIVRWMSTTDKVSIILPLALNIISPKKNTFWPRFTKLRDLRNEIIHYSSELPADVKENERILSLLLNESVFGKINSASELIKKIYAEIPPSPVMPILNNSEEIIPNAALTWESLGLKKIDEI